MGKQVSKDRILEAAAEIIHVKGFNHTGIQEILDAARVPKGSFYFYFKSKEDLGLQLVDYYCGIFGERMEEHLGNKGLPPLERLRSFFGWCRQYFAGAGYTRGCPIGNLSQELSDLNPNFRERLRRAMGAMAEPIAEVLIKARERGEVRLPIEPIEIAKFIIASWEGSLLCMKLERSSLPLERFERVLFETILEPPERQICDGNTGA